MNTTKKRLLWIVALVLILGAGGYAYKRLTTKGAGGAGPPVQPVRVAEAKLDDVDVFFQALGTVVSPNTVTVKSRVDGQLMALHFTEGQSVREGDLLAEIDPRPFEVQLQQAQGQLARDEALLKQANLELQRYRRLVKEQSVSIQQLQAQEGVVGQYEGTVMADKAAVADARLQLTYSRVTAPVSGRVGLRKVDVGNMIRSSDSDGIVVITQMDPMDVVFTLVEKQIPDVVQAMRQAAKEESFLAVEAWGQDNKTLLAAGRLLTIDNQIDTATGTVKAKAEFANADRRLFPNQFVNARLKVSTLRQVLVVPASSLQRNNEGFFVYVVEKGRTRSQAVTTSYSTDTLTVVADGLKVGDVVVIDGVDRLRDGMRVSYEGEPRSGGS